MPAPARKVLHDAGMPAYDTPLRAVRGFMHIVRLPARPARPAAHAALDRRRRAPTRAWCARSSTAALARGAAC